MDHLLLVMLQLLLCYLLVHVPGCAPVGGAVPFTRFRLLLGACETQAGAEEPADRQERPEQCLADDPEHEQLTHGKAFHHVLHQRNEQEQEQPQADQHSGQRCPMQGEHPDDQRQRGGRDRRRAHEQEQRDQLFIRLTPGTEMAHRRCAGPPLGQDVAYGCTPQQGQRRNSGMQPHENQHRQDQQDP